MRNRKPRSRVSATDHNSDMSSSLFSNRELEYKKVPSSFMNETSQNSSQISGNRMRSSAGLSASGAYQSSKKSEIHENQAATGEPLRTDPPSGIREQQGSVNWWSKWDTIIRGHDHNETISPYSHETNICRHKTFYCINKPSISQSENIRKVLHRWL